MNKNKFKELVFGVFALQDMQERLLFELKEDFDPIIIDKIKILKSQFRKFTSETDDLLSTEYAEKLGERMDSFQKEVNKLLKKMVK